MRILSDHSIWPPKIDTFTIHHEICGHGVVEWNKKISYYYFKMDILETSTFL